MSKKFTVGEKVRLNIKGCSRIDIEDLRRTSLFGQVMGYGGNWDVTVRWVINKEWAFSDEWPEDCLELVR